MSSRLVSSLNGDGRNRPPPTDPLIDSMCAAHASFLSPNVRGRRFVGGKNVNGVARKQNAIDGCRSVREEEDKR